MTCNDCVDSVEEILQKLPGVKGAAVTLKASVREVEYAASAISKDAVVHAIKNAGFQAAFFQNSKQDRISLGLTVLHREKGVDILHDVPKKTSGLCQFDVDTALSEVKIVFDPETVVLRSVVHIIEMDSSGRLKAHVQNPYTQ